MKLCTLCRVWYMSTKKSGHMISYMTFVPVMIYLTVSRRAKKGDTGKGFSLILRVAI